MQLEEDNLKENYCLFKQNVKLMFTGLLKSWNESEKCCYLLFFGGPKGRDVYNTWTDICEEDRQKLQTYYDRFENHVSPKANPVFARFKFHSRT